MYGTGYMPSNLGKWGLNKGQQHNKVLPSSLRVQRHNGVLWAGLGKFLGVVVVLASGLLGGFLLVLGLVLEGGFTQVVRGWLDVHCLASPE